MTKILRKDDEWLDACSKGMWCATGSLGDIEFEVNFSCPRGILQSQVRALGVLRLQMRKFIPAEKRVKVTLEILPPASALSETKAHIEYVTFSGTPSESMKSSVVEIPVWTRAALRSKYEITVRVTLEEHSGWLSLGRNRCTYDFKLPEGEPPPSPLGHHLLPISIPPCQSSLNVVFFHGLIGDCVATWSSSEDPRDFWPAWISNKFPEIRVWTVSALAPMLRGQSGGRAKIEHVAESIASSFKDCGLCSSSCIIVAHSYGGILAKSVARALSTKAGLDTWLKSVIFCGTPHRGSSLKALLTLLKNLLPGYHAVASEPIKQIHTISGHSTSDHQWFMSPSRPWHHAIVSFAESEPIPGVRRVAGVVVPEESALLDGHPLRVLNRNHVNLVKPEDENDYLYIEVIRLIDQFRLL